MVTSILNYSDIEYLQEIVRLLRKVGAKSDAKPFCQSWLFLTFMEKRHLLRIQLKKIIINNKYFLLSGIMQAFII